jgi:ABC-type branched-subunit amino acid transport system substrate-binding protein
MTTTMRPLLAAILAFGVAWPAAAQEPKVTNKGISATEIVIGSHQDLSGPIKGWGTGAANGLKMAADEINAAGGINGRKIRLIIEDSGYDPKKAVLATQKLVEKDEIFALVGALGSPTVLAAQDIVLDAGVLQLFPLTAAEFTYRMDASKPQERLKFSNNVPYVESTAAATKWMVETNGFKAPCALHQDDEFGKSVLDGFVKYTTDARIKVPAITSYKRGAADFSSQVARMKADGCDFIVLGTVIRETIGVIGEAKKLGWNVPMMTSIASNVQEIPLLGKELVEGLFSASQFEQPYEDTASERVKGWLASYRKQFGTEPSGTAIIGYNAMATFAHYAKLAGPNLNGKSMLDALEGGSEYKSIFNTAPAKFSKANHLATTVTAVQQIKGGRWVNAKTGLQY